ncbi:hypothetical protein COLO4_15262 [Corchorus olitorius]|uniref:Uncharacterized protein n=1 Tax=Corchorus olitorius TaxID=93759 RepID=A0A1R3JNW9_9ROSI|nr:hypothetical protein COLO4_15262 [Corchorus olitorius]
MAAAAAASSSLLLRPNSLKFKQYFPLHLPPPSLPRLSKPIGASTLRSHGSANKFNVKCFVLPEKSKQSCLYNSNRLSLSSNDKNQFEIIAETILKGLKALKKPAIAAVLLGLLLMYDPNKAALAASAPAVGVGVGARSSFFLNLVGLSGMGRDLERDLNRIVEVADTSTSEGLSNILTEATLALLRHPDYCISGCSSVDVKRSIDGGEKRFYQLSIEERGKFDEETLVNVNNIRRQSTASQKASEFSNEYMVITILVGVKGVHKLPPISGSGDIKEALQKLASIPTSKILGLELSWQWGLCLFSNGVVRSLYATVTRS